MHKYHADLVADLLSGHNGADRAAIAGKQHIPYFKEYFATCGAKTVVVENQYIDRDYLEDFAGYYVRCFAQYSRFAKRLHFFNIDFEKNKLESLLSATPGPLTAELLQQSYLGFVVVRPLPRTVVGRTCLKTYPSDNGRRNFPSIRSYEPNLFGIPLKVRTLAFQEQDSVTAACATSALWSVFQGTAVLFHHNVPSPVEITKSAGEHIPHSALPEGRPLPNSGLTATQLAYAVRGIGLEPHLVGVGDVYSLQSTVYAYLRGKMPLLLGVELGEYEQHCLKRQWRSMGGHAMALTGFSLGHAQPIPHALSGTLFTASRVDKLYGHDDQVGPFARLPIQPDGTLQTQWLLSSTARTGACAVAVPRFVLGSLYNKIRISNNVIERIVLQLDSIVETVRTANIPQLPGRLEWEVYLTTVNDVKQEWFSSLTDVNSRNRLLPKSLPKFLWRALGKCADAKHLDLLFDATDVAQGQLFVAGVDHAGVVAVALQAFKGSPHLVAAFDAPVRAVINASDTL